MTSQAQRGMRSRLRCPISEERAKQIRDGIAALTEEERKAYKEWQEQRSKQHSDAGKKGGRPKNAGARKTEYERGFADGVNCQCAICSERRRRLKEAANKIAGAAGV
jgi:hypothetical protein